MKISIIHPTKNRKDLCLKCFYEWTSKAQSNTNFQYILSVDSDDSINYEQLLPCDVLRLPNKSAIEAINNAAKIAVGDLIIVISDDFSCPLLWDMVLLDMLKGREDFLVKTQDGIQKTLITLPIMDRKYYERFGYVYEPGYLHMFCDQEMTAVGEMTGKVINLPISFPHNHYSVGGMKKDAINAKNDATWIQGQNYFDERLNNDFGLSHEQIVKYYSDIEWH